MKGLTQLYNKRVFGTLIGFNAGLQFGAGNNTLGAVCAAICVLNFALDAMDTLPKTDVPGTNAQPQNKPITNL